MADSQSICSVDGCEKPHVARGFCGTHYKRWRRDNPKPEQKRRKKCKVDGCDRLSHVRGMCGKHSYRFTANGCVNKARKKTDSETMQEFVDGAVASITDDCIEWPFAKSAGYARMVIEGKSLRVSRLVLERTVGEAPSEVHVAAHKPRVCHNPACINPRHLRWATPSENEADKLLDGTRARGERSGNSKLTEQQVIIAYKSPASMRQQLAERFGVSKDAIKHVQIGKTWRHVTRGLST